VEHHSQCSDQVMGWMIWGFIAAEARDFSFLQNIQTSSWGPPSLLIQWVTWTFHMCKAAGAWSWPITSI